MVLRFMANNGSEGLSPDEWLPDRISVGFLTIFFTPELRDAPVDEAGAREQRCRLLPTRLAVYFTLALWPFRGRNCGYGQMMTKLADGLYNQRRGADLLSGQLDLDGWVDAGDGRRWRPARISFPHALARRVERHQRRPQDPVLPARALDDHLRQGYWLPEYALTEYPIARLWDRPELIRAIHSGPSFPLHFADVLTNEVLAETGCREKVSRSGLGTAVATSHG